MTERIRLFIVEDQPKILKSQMKLLDRFDDIVIVGAALSGEEALKAISDMTVAPHVILCDIGLPKMSGIEVARSTRKSHPKTEVLMFTVFEEEERVLEAIRAGAAGYLLKGAQAEKIVEAIRDVHQGGTVIQPKLARALLKYFNAPQMNAHEGRSGARVVKQIEVFDDIGSGMSDAKNRRRQLTERELECLQMIAKGLSNSEAADVLDLSKATIRTHLEHIYQKLDVTNRVEAVTEGIRQGIIEL
jgi:DNA-binding NarL/FixJ family response regulator